MKGERTDRRGMRAREAAGYLGIGESSVWALAAAGEIVAVKLAPKTTIFLIESLDALIERRRAKVAA